MNSKMTQYMGHSISLQIYVLDRIVMVLRLYRSCFPKPSKEAKGMLFCLLPALNPSGAEIGSFLRKHFLIQQIPKADPLLTEEYGSCPSGAWLQMRFLVSTYKNKHLFKL